MGKGCISYTRLEMASAMYEGLRPGDKAFFRACVAYDFLKYVYGANSPICQWITDKKLVLHTKTEWFKEHSRQVKNSPPPPSSTSLKAVRYSTFCWGYGKTCPRSI